MKRKVGIIGIGVVGDAVKHGMESLGHKVTIHDIRLGTQIIELIDTEVCFICVPSPAKASYECDTGIVDSVLQELNEISYKGIIAIKSTVPPQSTIKFQEKYGNDNICFVPEFLRERCAQDDFVNNHDICVIGSQSKTIFEVIKSLHGHFPKKFIHLNPSEAEIVKYLNNVYAATLVTLANNFFDVCEASGADYQKVKEAFIEREHIHDSYLDSSEELRGYSGPCLPKDVKAMAFYAEERNINSSIFKFLDKENDKYEKTVLKGMRKEGS